ncbi:hypothetical protein N7G274_005386 [Stereocaulon virgatum]|uniref:Uncharacterized protein n=1 Tax=Stereocaulon virgatum TaxID=373712 RepID=A0ABR4A6S6_9LECA
MTTRMIPSIYRFLQFQPGESAIDSVRSDSLEILEQFAEAVDENGPFLERHHHSLTLPWHHGQYVSGVSTTKKGNWHPRTRPSRSGREELVEMVEVMAAIESRRSIEQTTSEKEHYLPTYQKYADDTAQSELAKAT